MLQFKLRSAVFLFLFGMSLSTWATDSSNPQLRQFKPTRMYQEAVTDTSNTITRQFDPRRDEGHTCPPGYAIGAVYQNRENGVDLPIYRGCWGGGAGGVYVYCNDNVERHPTLIDAPSVKYTCVKIKNRWVS
ncbi:MAG: hypothetical protein ACD_46C00353G0003 [uncultured bacterium]|nr:MAG: hypothetical protein ACD_46C00353G0003 [uncultured bacterium]